MSKMVSKFALAAGLVLALVFTFGCAGNPPLPPKDITVEKGTYTDFRDGKTYKTVKIGEQIWMAENLNYNTSGSKCYDNNPDNCAKYGLLYDRNSALKVCPDGWHLPSKEEWQTLMDLAGGEKFATKRLKAVYGWSEFKGKSGNGTDNYSFSALPGGYGNSDGSFQLIDLYGSWWSVSEPTNPRFTYGFSIFNSDLVSLGNQEKNYLYSVRCISHEEALRKLVGTWEGSYYATQGETGLTLDVYEETGSYKAIFRFYNLAGRTNAKEGAYRMSISYYTQADMNTERGYSLKFQEWIEQPSGYMSLDINGTLNGDVFSGKTNLGGKFSVTRKSGLSNTSTDKVSGEQQEEVPEAYKRYMEAIQKAQQEYAEALQKPQQKLQEAQKLYTEVMQKAQQKLQEATQKPQQELQKATQKPQQELQEAQKRYGEATQKAQQEYAKELQKAQQEPQKAQQELQEAQKRYGEATQKALQEYQEATKKPQQELQEANKRYAEATQKPQQEYTEALQKPQQEWQEAQKRYTEAAQEAQPKLTEAMQKAQQEYQEAAQK
jgi:uncharacterized protein (TIGR02145 family)